MKNTYSEINTALFVTSVMWGMAIFPSFVGLWRPSW